MHDDEPQVVRVNFGVPIPLFPLDSVTLLPHQALPLHIFEARYRQMTEKALDSAGLIAMALYDKSTWQDPEQYSESGAPPLRDAVCIGHIVQHESMPDGRYNILLQGVCRARIAHETPPNSERLYREAFLEPVGIESEAFEGSNEMQLGGVRDRLESLLSEGPLSRLSMSRPVLAQLANDAVPTSAVLELVSFALIDDTERRYRLLAEPDAAARSAIIFDELGRLGTLIRQAEAQRSDALLDDQDDPDAWPRGMSWN